MIGAGRQCKDAGHTHTQASAVLEITGCLGKHCLVYASCHMYVLDMEVRCLMKPAATANSNETSLLIY